MHKQLSVVIPVYNSQDSIAIVVNRLLEQYASSYNMEIILVNDASIDRSREVCFLLATQYSNINFLDLNVNGGQHAAILQGLRLAQGNYIALMDDDLQTHPDELMKLIHKMKSGYDVVIAQRVKYDQTPFRRFLSSINTLIINQLLKTPKKIYFSSFLVMKKSVGDEILSRAAASSNPNIQGLILQITDHIANEPTVHRQRPYGKSNYTIFKLIKFGLNSLNSVTTSKQRVLLFTSLSLLLIVGFVCLYLFIWVVKLLMHP